METLKQIIERDGSSFWKMQWETTLPTIEQWNEIHIIESIKTRININL